MEMGSAWPYIPKHYTAIITWLKVLEYLRGVVVRFGHGAPKGVIIGKQCVEWEDDPLVITLSQRIRRGYGCVRTPFPCHGMGTSKSLRIPCEKPPHSTVDYKTGGLSNWVECLYFLREVLKTRRGGG